MAESWWWRAKSRAAGAVQEWTSHCLIGAGTAGAVWRTGIPSAFPVAHPDENDFKVQTMILVQKNFF
jgi:hypothetical protein